MQTPTEPPHDPDTLDAMAKTGKNRDDKIVVKLNAEEKARILAAAGVTGEDGSGFLRRLGLTEVQRVEATKGGT